MNKKAYLAMLLGLVLVGLAILSQPQHVESASTAVTPQGYQQEDGGSKPSNDYCLLCHSNPDLAWELPSGERLTLQVDPDALAHSVHGADLGCADCHENYRFPHQPQTSQTVRQYQLQRYASCRACHEDQYLHAQDSVHGSAVRQGRIEAAICIDCHGGHDIQTPADPPQRVSFTCGQCHGAIFQDYRESIHGKALVEEGNTDVPVCTDCHGTHTIQDPTTALFRVRSPQLCADCHADSALMGRYNISTNVFDSYLDDFHGATVALFEQQDPNVATNKAVCYDCHGVHNIQPVENGEAIRKNLLITCQECHPDAGTNFPAAWVGHYEPTFAKNPLLTIANRLYGALIPLVGVAMAFFIGTDVLRRIRLKSGR